MPFKTETIPDNNSDCEETEVSPVSRAVHGLESEDLLFHLEGEHVLTVVLPMPRCLPEFAVVDIGSHNLLEAPLPVLTLAMNVTMFSHKVFQKAQLHNSVYPSPLQTTG